MEFFYASALRHYKDAQILKEQGRYDNAVHLYGFAAECALKNLIAVYCDVGTIKKKYGHSGGGIIKDLYMFAANGTGSGILEPSLSLKLDVYKRQSANHPSPTCCFLQRSSRLTTL